MNYAIIRVEWEEKADTKKHSILQIGDTLEDALKGLRPYDGFVNHHWSDETKKHEGTRIKITTLELHQEFDEVQSLESKVKNDD